MSKKVKQKYFSVVTKNLNWEIVTINLVTFKSWDGIQGGKFSYCRGLLKNLILRGVS